MDNFDSERDYLASRLTDRQQNLLALQQVFHQMYSTQQPGTQFQILNQARQVPVAAKVAPWAYAPLKKIIPYVQALNIDDLESCVALENAAFQPSARASREKIAYRLENAGLYSLGLFATVELDSLSEEVAETLVTLKGAVPVVSDDKNRVSVLIGHVLATKTFNQVVRDEDMEIPDAKNSSDGPVGHQEAASNLAIHSFAILPRYQKMGLGSVLMQAFLYRIRGSGVIDRIILITKSDLLSAYSGMSFTKGEDSKVTLDGGNWIDMFIDIEHVHPADSDYEDDDKDDEEEDEINVSDFPSLRNEIADSSKLEAETAEPEKSD